MHDRARFLACSLVILLASLLLGSPGARVTIPGSVNQLCTFSQFFYNYPESDFLYHFNDRLLFLEPPDNKVYTNNWRHALCTFIDQHGRIKEYIASNSKTPEKSAISLSLSTAEGVQRAADFCQMLGLSLLRYDNGQLGLSPSSEDPLLYYTFGQSNLKLLEKQMNEQHILRYELKEKSLPIPWDLSFLSLATGRQLTEQNFLTMLLHQKSFSLFLACLYRLSDLEIEFLSSLGESPNDFWKMVYANKRLLMGFFVLSNALRVRDHRLALPGGAAAEAMWAALAEAHPREEPLEFIRSLATKDEGKLNYLFTFASFLPEEKLRVLFLGYDPDRMGKVYSRIRLRDEEKLRPTAFPRLDTCSFFSLPYVLRVEKDAPLIPGGASLWIDALQKAYGVEPDREGSTAPDGYPRLLHVLLSLDQDEAYKMRPLRVFITLYAKFADRPELLDAESLPALIQACATQAVAVDYLEKIPFRSPQTVLRILKWANSFEGLSSSDRPLLTAVAQAVLEVFAHASRLRPESIDWDRQLAPFWTLPPSRSAFLNQVLGLFTQVEGSGRMASPLDFLFAKPERHNVAIDGVEFTATPDDLFRAHVEEILQTQAVCSYDTIAEAMALIRRMEEPQALDRSRLALRLREILQALPYPELADKAPAFIRKRVLFYSRDDLDKDSGQLVARAEFGKRDELFPGLLQGIREQYLLPQLRDYLLALAYALNAREPEMRGFSSPNFARLHDFSDAGEQGPWNYCGRWEGKRLTGFTLRGGLSQLGIGLAGAWREHLFGSRIIMNGEHVQAILASILDLYPTAPLGSTQEWVGMRIDSMLDLLERAKTEPALAQHLTAVLGACTSGYRYRQTQDYLLGRQSDYFLFFADLDRVARLLPDLPALVTPTLAEKWQRLQEHQPKREEWKWWGDVQCISWGAVTSDLRDIPPPELALFYSANAASGEMFREAKLRAGYHAYKRAYPPELLGQVLFQYVKTECRKYFSQNSPRDYASSYFVFDVMNPFHLGESIKKIQSEGGLKVK